MVAIEIVGSGD